MVLVNTFKLRMMEQTHLPLVPLGHGRSTSMPLCVWGHRMSLRSTLSQKRLGKGNDSRDGGVVVRDGATGGLGGLLPTLVPVVFMVVVRPLCCAVVVVIVVVVIRGGAGTEVASEIGGAERKKINLVHDDLSFFFF